MKRINKSDIINEISKETDKDELTVKEIVDCFLISLESHIIDGKIVNLKGFATFSLREAKPRISNNFSSKKEKKITPARRLPKVIFSRAFKNKIE